MSGPEDNPADDEWSVVKAEMARLEQDNAETKSELGMVKKAFDATYNDIMAVADVKDDPANMFGVKPALAKIQAELAAAGKQYKTIKSVCDDVLGGVASLSTLKTYINKIESEIAAEKEKA